MVVPDVRLILIQCLLEWRSQVWSPFKDLQKQYTNGSCHYTLLQCIGALACCPSKCSLNKALDVVFLKRKIKMCSVGGLLGSGLGEK